MNKKVWLKKTQIICVFVLSLCLFSNINYFPIMRNQGEKDIDQYESYAIDENNILQNGLPIGYFVSE